MKPIFFAIMLVLLIAPAPAAPAEDPLLDAKLDLAVLRLTYQERHPKVIAARARLDALATASQVTPAQHRAHIQKRLREAEAEDSRLSGTHTEKHPKRVEVMERVRVLKAELERARNE